LGLSVVAAATCDRCSIKPAPIIEPLLGDRRISANSAATTIERHRATAAAAIPSQWHTRKRAPRNGTTEPVCAVDLFPVDSVPDGHFG
jgi:hypothetical protein